MAYIRAHVPHFSVESEVVAKKNHFPLHKNPWAVVLVTVFVVLITYALIDSFFGLQESYVDSPFYRLYIGSGIVFAALAGALLRKQRVPAFEIIVVAGLSGITLGCALHPGLLRLNQLTDVDGLQRYAYRLVSNKRFAPLRGGLPTLHFTKYDDYWAQLKVGSIHQFELRRGGLGFYQVNMAPIKIAVRNYYHAARNEDLR